ncbi:MAG: hypothetical protein U9R00_01270 [Patescibacteria group bacterium]|nr:hypothetical protein [Patescibacteria group bacterium]
MEIKLIALILSIVFLIASYLPYLRNIFRRKTQPHAYTWLIWTITVGTATLGIWYGNGGLAVLTLLITTIFNLIIFILSFKYGTKNITKSDTIFLVIAFIAIFIWWQLKQPLIALIIVTLIDFFGFIPTIRKTWQEPWSETTISWIFFVISTIFLIISLKQYNLMTLIYLLIMGTLDTITASLCILRRRKIEKPY